MKRYSGAASVHSLTLLAVVAASLPGTASANTSATAKTWIGRVTAQHCTPEHKALPGDDERCVVFIASDRQVYTIANQDAAEKYAGREVAITGTLEELLVIGVTYETQGIIHVDSLSTINPMTLTAEEQTRFQTWMKGMQPKVTAVRDVIVAKDKSPLPEAANKLAAAFDEVGDFMRKHNSEDAAKFAETARDAARTLGSASLQVEQILALRKVQETCAACHLAHRAGKQGEYVIQP